MAIDTNRPLIQPAHTAIVNGNGSKVSNYAPVGDRSNRFGAVKPVKKRCIVLASGMQKHGKDHFGFTAPGPIALHAFDEGWDDAANKFIKTGKDIMTAVYEVPEAVSKSKDMNIQAHAGQIWSDFVDNFLWSLDNCRSVVVDTATEMWELLRLARFGAQSTGQTTSFGPVNAEMRKLIRECYNHDANVIFLQKLGKKYMKREWDGEWEPKGWGDMAFEVQVVLRLWRENPNIFHTYIEDVRQDPKWNGEDRVEVAGIPVNSFPYIAADIYGDDVNEWL